MPELASPAPTPRPTAPPGTPAGYLVYALLLGLPFAYQPHPLNTLYALEFQRSVLWGALALIGGLVVAFAPRLWRRKHPLHRPLLVFLAGAALSTVASRIPGLSAEVLAYLVVGGLLFYLAALVMDRDADLPRLEVAVGLGGTLVAVYSLVQHAGANPLALVNEGDLQCSVTFPTRNLMATYLAFALVVSVDRFLAAGRLGTLVPWGVAMAAIAPALALSLTVGAWVAVGVALVAHATLSALLHRRGVTAFPRERWIGIAAIGVVVAGAFALRGGDRAEDVGAKLADLWSGEHVSVRQREVMFAIAQDIFAEHVATGAGPGMFDIARGAHESEYLAQERYWPLTGLSPYPHCDPLHVASEMGLLGAVPYAWLCLAFLLLPLRLLGTSDATRAHLARVRGWWCGALAILVHGLVHFSLYAPAAGFCLFLALGVCASSDLRFGRKPLVTGPRATRAVRVLAALLGLGLAPYFALHYLARAWQETGLDASQDAARAIQAYDVAMDRSRELERAGQADAAHRAMVDAVAIAEGSKVAYARAHEHYRRAARWRPWSQSLWHQIGGFERLRRYPEESCRAYRRGLAYAPDDYQLHQALAELTLEDNRPDQARLFAQLAIRLRPNAAPSHCLLGIADLNDKLVAPALAHFATARRADDRFPGGYLYAAMAHGIAGEPARGLDLLLAGVERVERKADREALLMLAVMMSQNAGLLDIGERLRRLVPGGSHAAAPELHRVASQRAEDARARLGQEMLVELVRRVRAVPAGLAADTELAARAMFLVRDVERAIEESLARWAAGDADGGERAAHEAGAVLTALEQAISKVLETLEFRRQAGERVARATQLDLGRERDLARALRDAVEQGTVVGKAAGEEDSWRAALTRRLGRVYGLTRAQRRALGLAGPIYQAELAHLARFLAPSDAHLGSAAHTRDLVLADDVAVLAAEGELAFGAHTDAVQRLDSIAARGGLKRTLLPEWAAHAFDGASDEGRAYYARRTPDTANVAMVLAAEVELYAGRPRAALDRALATVRHCRAMGDELDSRGWELTPGLTRELEAGDPTATATRALLEGAHRHACDRRALEVALLAALAAGDLAAARDAAAGLEQYSVPLRVIPPLNNAAARVALQAELWLALETR